MRAVWGSLLAAICLHSAQGLMCYTCNTPTSSSECNQPTNCTALSPKFAVCKTTIMSPDDVGFPFHGNETVFRQCAQSCIPTGQNWIGITKRILCCNVDLCNRNGIRDGSSDPCDSVSSMSFSAVTVTVSLVTAVIRTSPLL